MGENLRKILYIVIIRMIIMLDSGWRDKIDSKIFSALRLICKMYFIQYIFFTLNINTTFIIIYVLICLVIYSICFIRNK